MNTPRTDAHEKAMGTLDINADLTLAYVHARQLETELQTMTALADRLAEALERQVGFPHCPRAKVLSKTTLAAYEAHKKGKSPVSRIKQPCDCIEKCGKYWVQRCDCQNSTSLAEAQSWCDDENKKGNTP